MSFAVPAGLGILAAAMVVAAPLLHRVQVDRDVRNLRAVHDGRLYRCGQLPPAGFDRTIRENRIRTVISLRDSKDTNDETEVGYCRRNGIAHHRLTPLGWSAPDGSVPAAKNVERLREIYADPATEWPILIHCFAGIHRTGAAVAIYRMEYDGWGTEETIREMLSMGTPRTTFEDDMLSYLRSYRPRGGKH